MRYLAAVPALLLLTTACSSAADGASDIRPPSAPAAAVSGSASPGGPPPDLRGCDPVEVTIWMNGLGLSGWSVGEIVSGRTGLYMPDHAEAAERIAAVQKKCGDKVQVETGPPIKLLG